MTKVIRWLIFGALVSLLPLGFALADLQLRHEAVSLAKVIGNGELLVINWVLCASAFGELIGAPKRVSKNGQVIFGGLTFILILASALFFASIAEARASNTAIDEAVVVNASIYLFLVSLVPSTICVAYAAGDDDD